MKKWAIYVLFALAWIAVIVFGFWIDGIYIRWQAGTP
jgi:hypothetical protein